MSKNKQVIRNRIAKRFAIALFSISKSFEEKVLVEHNLEVFINLLKENDRLKTFFYNKVTEIEDLKSASKTISEEFKFQENTRNFLLLLSEDRRFDLINLIFADFKLLLQDLANKKEVLIESTSELSKKDEEELNNTLSGYLNKELVITKTINPDLIGGVKIQFDSYLFDASIKGKLNRIKQQLNIS